MSYINKFTSFIDAHKCTDCSSVQLHTDTRLCCLVHNMQLVTALNRRSPVQLLGLQSARVQRHGYSRLFLHVRTTKKQNLEHELHLFSSGTAYWLCSQHCEFFFNSSQSCVILPSLQQRSDPQDSASESDLFASLPSHVLKLNPLLEFLKISKILLKSLLQLVDIKLLSLMWCWFDKNFKRIPSVCGTTSDVQQVTLCCFSCCGFQL